MDFWGECSFLNSSRHPLFTNIGHPHSIFIYLFYVFFLSRICIALSFFPSILVWQGFPTDLNNTFGSCHKVLWHIYHKWECIIIKQWQVELPGKVAGLPGDPLRWREKLRCNIYWRREEGEYLFIYRKIATVLCNRISHAYVLNFS